MGVGEPSVRFVGHAADAVGVEARQVLLDGLLDRYLPCADAESLQLRHVFDE